MRRQGSTSRRSGWHRTPPRMLLVTVAFVVLAASACAQGRTVPTAYGDTTERGFTEGCEESLASEGAGDEAPGSTIGGDDRRSVCACAYDEISGPDGIPFARFRQIFDEMEAAPDELPSDMRRVLERCLDTMS